MSDIMMKRRDFAYHLPEALIAHYPSPNRSGSRLLCLDGNTGALAHRYFYKLPDLLAPGDLLILNDSKVVPARLFGRKATGGKVELLVERLLDQHHFLAHCKASKRPSVGTTIIIADDIILTVMADQAGLLLLALQTEKPLLTVLEAYGHVPLPPYIRRTDEKIDRERYQTIYANYPGSVAAPTAGLHFDHALLDQLKQSGVQIAYVTLHVGAGTFQPVRVENIDNHQMHAEYATLPSAVCAQIQQTKQQGKRVIAVGTTATRTLETASLNGMIEPFCGETRLFIKPGFAFQCVDAMITNFHLPESTLLMLVCAFAGRDHIMQAYQEAIKQQYRFYSYGDAMFITRKKP